MRFRVSLIAATLTVGVWLATPAWADIFSGFYPHTGERELHGREQRGQRHQ